MYLLICCDLYTPLYRTEIKKYTQHDALFSIGHIGISVQKINRLQFVSN
jgi:hypothetical protein